MRGKLIDLTGQKFGRLTVLERVDRNKHGKVRWLCKCACGNVAVVLGESLRNGRTKSCGCLKQESKTTIHGGYKTRLYHVWRDMKRRCYNPKDKRYNDYGGRGITVCAEWLHDFAAF